MQQFFHILNSPEKTICKGRKIKERNEYYFIQKCEILFIRDRTTEHVGKMVYFPLLGLGYTNN